MASSPPPPPPSSSSLSWLASSLRNFHVRHERLQKAVHEGFRYPLPKWGRWAMGGVYFVLPIVGGMCVMQWAIARSHANIGVNGELLPLARQKLRDDNDVSSEDGCGSPSTAATTTTSPPVLGLRRADGTAVGAGGWGGGVHLAVSDEETQRRNRRKLDKFLRKQQKLHQPKQQRTDPPKPKEEVQPVVEAAAG